MAKWVCSVCGYVHEGDEAPEVCPVCKAPASKFTKQDENLTWAAEHVVGVAQGVSKDRFPDNLLCEQLLPLQGTYQLRSIHPGSLLSDLQECLR